MAGKAFHPLGPANDLALALCARPALVPGRQKGYGKHCLATSLVVLIASALPACAHTSSTERTSLQPDFIAMTTQQDMPEQKPQPGLDEKTVLLKVLELIRTSKSVGDITPGRLTELTGRPVGFDGQRYGVGGELTKEWGYAFEVDPDAFMGALFLFSFEPNEQGQSPPATDICTIDFDYFSSELQKQGFKKEIRYGEHGRILSYPFNNGVLAINVSVEGESNTPMEKLRHLCVRSVEVR